MERQDKYTYLVAQMDLDQFSILFMRSFFPAI